MLYWRLSSLRSMPAMSDRRLKAFYTVARLASFTKAAKVLHLTQPAVTFQVRQLESYYKTRLFDRAHNRVTLTESGRKAFGYAEQIFELYKDLDLEMNRLSGDMSGPVTIAASNTIAVYMLPRLLREFRAQHPQMALRLKVSNTEGAAMMVENGMADMGIVEGPVFSRGLQVDVCKMDELVAIAPPSHPLLRAASVRVGQVLQHPFIMREEGSGTREVIIEYLKSRRVNLERMDIVMELGSLEAIKAAVESGMGVSILSRGTIRKELDLKTLGCASLAPALKRKLSLVCMRRLPHPPAATALMDFALDFCAASEAV